MLSSADDLKASLLALKPTKDSSQGIKAFVGVIADFMSKIQGGPLGTPGILTFGSSAMEAILMTMQPVSDSSWISKFADAFEAGLLTSIITPGTITNPVWLGSGGLDILTLPSGAATIITIPVAKALLVSGLASVGPTSDAPLPLATAIRNAALALVFLAIGLGPPPTFIPTPIPTSAQ
jgi:hypothetical protein